MLPASIHSHLPSHHPGLVITDIAVKKCSSINPLTSCASPGPTWHKISKDLYLKSGWVNSAYVFVERKKEEELGEGDRVVTDVAVSLTDPTTVEGVDKWEKRPAGVWIMRKDRKLADSGQAVTGIDVLFGPDAVDPREGWEMRDTALLLDSSGEAVGARLSIRKGTQGKLAKPVPRVNDNGKFKILQVADLHLSTGVGKCRDAMPDDGRPCEADTRTLEFVGKILDDEKPDLVVLSGDQVNGDTAPDAETAIFKYAELFIKRKIPYVTIFGNHDDEKTLGRKEQMEIIEALPYSLSQAGPEDIDGIGNYYIEILARGTSHHSAITIYLLDTHAYSPDERTYHGYDWLKKSQIDWFKSTAEGLKEDHKKYTHTHMNLAFIHIPLPEYRIEEQTKFGGWLEGVTAPFYNSGFRDALVEQNVLMVSCGHDHANDYCALSKDGEENKLWMCYAGGSGFGGYGGYGGMHRKLRVFEMDMNEALIRTYTRVEYGETEKRIGDTVIVEGGRVVAPPK